jgi:hypothetical protein
MSYQRDDDCCQQCTFVVPVKVKRFEYFLSVRSERQLSKCLLQEAAISQVGRETNQHSDEHGHRGYRSTPEQATQDCGRLDQLGKEWSDYEWPNHKGKHPHGTVKQYDRQQFRASTSITFRGVINFHHIATGRTRKTRVEEHPH